MSHNVRYSSYKVLEGKAEEKLHASVQAEWDDYAAHEDWAEGCHGLPGSIRWINHVCEDYEEAKKYIEEHDSGWYDQLAVKYKNVPDSALVKTKQYEILKERMERLQARYIELRDKIHYQGCKSEYISCRGCGSKLASKYFGTRLNNKCPVCLEDLRPESTLELIENAKKNATKAQTDYQEEVKKMRAKQEKKSELYWLVKIEYHT